VRSVPALDGVRAVAACLVVLTHVGFQSGLNSQGVVGALAARGDVGVAVFFVLSGFLLCRPWISSRPPRPGRYARTRAARILPAYWLALGGVLLLGTGDPDTATVGTNVLLLQGYTFDFLPAFTQTWSLTTEVAFYAVLPLLALPLRARKGRTAWLAALLVTGLSCTALSAAGPHPVLGLSVLGHMGWFAAGLALAVTESADARGTAPAWLSRTLERVRIDAPTVLAATAALLLVAATPLAGPRDLAPVGPVTAVLKEILYLVIAASFVGVAIWGSPTAWPSRVLASPAARWLGSVSYGVFLWHLLVLETVTRALGLPLFGGHALFLLGTVLVLSVGLGWVSLALVETPARALARKAGGRDRQGDDAGQLVPAGRDR
jgi:peptidoglycan/LPS O-acetylase OafA/YrhL